MKIVYADKLYNIISQHFPDALNVSTTRVDIAANTKLACSQVNEQRPTHWASVFVLIGRMSRFTFPPSTVFRYANSSRMSMSIKRVKVDVSSKQYKHKPTDTQYNMKVNQINLPEDQSNLSLNLS